MVKSIGVQTNMHLKVYDCKDNPKIKIGDKVVIKTQEGIQLGDVIYINKRINEKNLDAPLVEIKRVANAEDFKKEVELKEKAKEMLPIFVDKIKKFDLPMKPVGVSITFDEEKIIFYFTSENRVDFRELAKDLIRALKKQVRLHQVGPRDAARILGGFGVCGKPLCCNIFLKSLESITMDMAREQNVAFKGSSKISGVCGRLMCCLAFEEDIKEKPQTSEKEPIRQALLESGSTEVTTRNERPRHSTSSSWSRGSRGQGRYGDKTKIQHN